MRETLRTSNGFVVGSKRIISRTSVAACGNKAATTLGNLVLCVVICFGANWASTCANKSLESENQNGGIFPVTAFVATAAFEADVNGPLDAEEVVVMATIGYVSCRGHKCGKWLC